MKIYTTTLKYCTKSNKINDLMTTGGGRDVVSYSRGTSGEDSNSISAAADAMRNSRYETAM